MKKIVAVATSATLVLMSTLASIAPADAQRGPGPDRRQAFVADWCRTHPGDPDCRSFGRGGWSDSQYRAWYLRHQHDRGFAPGAAGLFGAIIGGAIGAAAANSARSSSHVRACEARYRSYDPSSDTYLGTDGRRHACTL
ncbi:MAG TPA: BA14K family protein [Devosia sp.]|nr:BA14K family protein [Devosia sp.]